MTDSLLPAFTGLQVAVTQPGPAGTAVQGSCDPVVLNRANLFQ